MQARTFHGTVPHVGRDGTQCPAGGLHAVRQGDGSQHTRLAQPDGQVCVIRPDIAEQVTGADIAHRRHQTGRQLDGGSRHVMCLLPASVVALQKGQGNPAEPRFPAPAFSGRSGHT